MAPVWHILRGETSIISQLLRAQTDVLDRTSLRWINAYNPGLSGAWMLQVPLTLDLALVLTLTLIKSPHSDPAALTFA